MTNLIKTKSVWASLAVVIAIAVVAIVFLRPRHTNQQPLVSASPSVSVSPSPGASIVPVGKPKPIRGTLDVGIYNKLIYEYDGRRILLAADCQGANPSGINFKSGTKIMLDNSNSNSTSVVKLGSNSYTLAPHTWIFVTLSSTVLPINLPMFCNNFEIGRIGLTD